MDITLIQKVITEIIPLNNNEIAPLLDYFEIKKIPKNSFFITEGHVCNSIAFINKGVLIYYKLHDLGKEITTDFAFPGDWVSDNYSRINQQPSIINIKALEDSELLVISNKNLENCYEKFPKIERLGRILMEQAFVKITQQSIDLQTLSATERYNKLLHEYPTIFQKVPLYHIANYLGIAAKSLSRIRKKETMK